MSIYMRQTDYKKVLQSLLFIIFNRRQISTVENKGHGNLNSVFLFQLLTGANY